MSYEKYKVYQKKWFEEHPEYKKKYLERVKDKRIKTQEQIAGRTRPEVCEVCGSGGRIYFDHDHKTGRFRGWICQGCNSSLGHARDSQEVLYKLIHYLQKGQGVMLTQKQLSDLKYVLQK